MTSGNTPAELIERSAIAKVWPRSVADSEAEHLTPRQIEMLYAASDWAHEAADQLTVLTARVEELEAALDPFARVAAINEALALDWPDDRPARDVLPGAWPDWGDLKRARAALTGGQG